MEPIRRALEPVVRVMEPAGGALEPVRRSGASLKSQLGGPGPKGDGGKKRKNGEFPCGGTMGHRPLPF